MKRSCGVLLHITSLPSPYGIGTLGKEAEEFVNFLRDGGQKYWQVLPTNPVGYGNSPYQSYSAFAGEPLLIDLNGLVAYGLLSKKKCEDADFGADPTFVDFEKVNRVKMQLLGEAFKAFSDDVAFLAFLREEEAWLDDYALFMTVKEVNSGVPWNNWDEKIRFRESRTVDEFIEKHSERIKFWKFTQFFFRKQWDRLRLYSNRNGIKIIGDIPIYASPDSVDVWNNRELFLLDTTGKPKKVAGVPPDYFSKTGQLWGNPLYNWGAMKKDGYLWWIERFKNAAKLYDTIRIDHFRAFDTYYAIPYGEKTAVSGQWETGPGMDLFDAINKEKALSNFPIIAEDLGEIFDSVKALLLKTGFPGMKILQFGFNADNSDNEHLPHNYTGNMVVYTGTHDNSTINGFVKAKAAGKKTARIIKNYVKPTFFEPLHWACIRSLYASSAGMVVVPMQDLLGLDDSARFNCPGTVKNTNWIWRVTKKGYKKAIMKNLKKLSKVYYR